MKYRQLGNSDLKVSVVGLGGNTYGPPRIDQEMTSRNMHHAQELGINFVDTAAGYGRGESEAYIGNALKDRSSDWIIATKFNLRNREEGESVRDRIFKHCETSLAKLQTDCIDLYQNHFPDQSVSAEEVLEPLAELVQQGKVRYIGESNYAAWRHMQMLELAKRTGGPEMVSSQNHYNILRRHVELEVLPFCAANNVGFLPYFPLGGGYLTGKYVPGKPAPEGTRGAAGSPIVTRTRSERNEALLPQLEQYAKDHGHSVLELAFAWLVAHPQVSSVIAGQSSPEQVEANAKSADWEMTPEELEELNEVAAWDGSGERVEGGGM